MTKKPVKKGDRKKYLFISYLKKKMTKKPVKKGDRKKYLFISYLGVSYGHNIWCFHVGWTSSTNTNAKSVSWDKPNVCVFVRVQIFSNTALSAVESVLSRHALSKSCRLLNAQKMKKLKETTGEECLWQWGEKSKQGHSTWEMREVLRQDGRKDDRSMRRR